MKRILVSLAAGGLVLFTAWISGYNFDHRGPEAVIATLFVLMSAGMTYSYPGWSHE